MRHSGVATRDDGDDNVLLHLRRAFLLRLTFCFATSMNERIEVLQARELFFCERGMILFCFERFF